MTRVMWIGAVMVVGGLAGLRRDWRRQAVDAGGCAVALTLACWQYPRIAPHVRTLWPVLAVPQVALLYLFTVLYGLWHVLVSVYAPDDQGSARRWIGGLIGVAQAGVLATLLVTLQA